MLVIPFKAQEITGLFVAQVANPDDYVIGQSYEAQAIDERGHSHRVMAKINDKRGARGRWARRRHRGLDVVSPKQVVQAGDGCGAPDGCVWAVMVVVVEPAVKGCGAFSG